MEDQGYSIHNVSEDLVEQLVDKCIQAAETCGCARCRADIVAHALNHFPAHYVVTDLGDMMVRTNVMDVQFNANVNTDIMTAIRLISAKPRHTEEESQKYWIERRNAAMKE